MACFETRSVERNSHGIFPIIICIMASWHCHGVIMASWHYHGFMSLPWDAMWAYQEPAMRPTWFMVQL